MDVTGSRLLPHREHFIILLYNNKKREIMGNSLDHLVAVTQINVKTAHLSRSFHNNKFATATGLYLLSFISGLAEFGSVAAIQ